MTRRMGRADDAVDGGFEEEKRPKRRAMIMTEGAGGIRIGVFVSFVCVNV